MPIDVPQDLLNEVGYQPQSLNITPEMLASVGYTPPRQNDNSLSGVSAGLVGGVLGEASNLIGTGIKNVGTLTGSDTLKDYGQSRVDNGAYLKGVGNKNNQTATTVGDYGTDVLAALVPGTSSIKGLAALGGATGLVTSKDKDAIGVLQDVGTGAALSAGIGFGVSKMIQGATAIASGVKGIGSKIVTGAMEKIKDIKTEPEDVARSALDITLKKSGGDLASANEKTLVASVMEAKKQAKTAANGLYEIRDAIAKKDNVMVERSGLKDLVDQLRAEVQTGATTETKNAYVQAKNVLGTGAPIPFEIAQRLVSTIGKSSNTAAQAGDANGARILGSVKDAITSDISKASGYSPELENASNTANAYYSKVYSPIKDLNKMGQKVTEAKFAADLYKGYANKKVVQTGLGAIKDNMDPTVLSHVIAAHQNAYLDSVGGEVSKLSLSRYAANLEKDIQTNKELYGAAGTDMLKDMQTLARVVDGKGMLEKARLGRIENSLAVGGGFAMTTGAFNPGFVIGAGVVPANYLYKAGKVLSRPDTRQLLNQMRGLTEKYPEADMTRVMAKKLYSLFNNQLREKTSQALAIFGADQN